MKQYAMRGFYVDRVITVKEFHSYGNSAEELCVCSTRRHWSNAG